MPKALNLVGQQFGRLTVIEKAGKSGGRVLWKCRCSCGKELFVITNNLTAGRTQSCGCLRDEILSNMSKSHGKSKTRMYKIWKSMRVRCYNKNVKEYKNYGARGITVCNEWNNSFDAFYNWSMAHGYTDELTIDRIDVNGNYEPSNCRWATYKEQARNKTNNVFITYNGEKKVMKDWAKIYGLKLHTLWYRLNVRGWSIEDALTTPVYGKYGNNKLKEKNVSVFLDNRESV